MEQKDNESSKASHDVFDKEDLQAILRVFNILRRWRNEAIAKNNAQNSVKSSGTAGNSLKRRDNAAKTLGKSHEKA